MRPILYYAKNYLRETTVHGFRYVVDGHGYAEKILWMISIITSLTLAAIMIKANLNDVAKNPISTSISTIPIQDVPFPAVTLSATHLRGVGRLQEAVLNSFKFDCTNEDKKCEDETSNLRKDIFPLLELTVKDMFEFLTDLLYHQNDFLSESLCDNFETRGAPRKFRSLVIELSHLYENSNEVHVLQESLQRHIALTFGLPEGNLVQKVKEFVLAHNADYVHEGNMNLSHCKKANYSRDAVVFAAAAVYSYGLLAIDQIPLGTYIISGQGQYTSFDFVEGKVPENATISKLTTKSLFPKILVNSTQITARGILEYLDNNYQYNRILPYEHGLLSSCEMHYYYDSDYPILCPRNSSTTDICCAYGAEIARDMGAVWKVMKYTLAPLSWKVIEMSDFQDLLILVKSLGYQVNNSFMHKNARPAILVCKYGRKTRSSHPSSCNMFRKTFTTAGLGYTFNNEPFSKMYKNTTDNKAFLEEMHKLVGDSNDSPPRTIHCNGQGCSLEFLVNHNYEVADNEFFNRKLVIHDSLTIADIRNEAIELEPGMGYEITVTPSVMTTDDDGLTLDPDQRNCLSVSEGDLDIFEQYSQSACLFECQLKTVFKKCNCTAWNYPRIEHGINLCFSQVAKECFERQMEPSVDLESCDCPNDCSIVHYSIVVQSKPLNSELFKMIEEDLFPRPKIRHVLLGHNSPGILIFKEKLKDVSFVRVTIAPKTVSQIVRTTRVSFSSQLANLGGIIGLFTGMSILSVAEIIFWILRFFKSHFTRKRTIQRRPYGII